jgi:hypothetical protein
MISIIYVIKTYPLLKYQNANYVKNVLMAYAENAKLIQLIQMVSVNVPLGNIIFKSMMSVVPN